MTTRTSLAAMLLIASVGLTACGDKKDKEAPKTSAAAQARTVSVGSVETRPLGGGRDLRSLLVLLVAAGGQADRRNEQDGGERGAGRHGGGSHFEEAWVEETWVEAGMSGDQPPPSAL